MNGATGASDMAGYAARVAVERSGSCRDTIGQFAGQPCTRCLQNSLAFQRLFLCPVMVPEKMLTVFSAVAGYEKYVRELRHRLTKLLQAKSHNRQLAEYQANQMMTNRGIPMLH